MRDVTAIDPRDLCTPERLSKGDVLVEERPVIGQVAVTRRVYLAEWIYREGRLTDWEFRIANALRECWLAARAEQKTTGGYEPSIRAGWQDPWEQGSEDAERRWKEAVRVLRPDEYATLRLVLCEDVWPKHPGAEDQLHAGLARVRDFWRKG